MQLKDSCSQLRLQSVTAGQAGLQEQETLITLQWSRVTEQRDNAGAQLTLPFHSVQDCSPWYDASHIWGSLPTSTNVLT